MPAVPHPVSFGYFVTALIATAVVATCASLQSLLIGWRHRHDRTPLAFATLCVCAGMLASYRATRQCATHDQRLRGAMLLACLLAQFLAILWCVVLIDAMNRPYPATDALEFLSFVLLLDATAADAAAAVQQGVTMTEHVLAPIARPLAVDSRAQAVGVSIGVATSPDAGSATTDIARRADIVLHWTKAAGRRSARQFEPQMQDEADTRLELERGLRLAVQRDELVLYLQPQVDRHGRLACAETLLRWHDPTLGTLPPDRFVHIAEETGLVHALGQWVINAACRQLREQQLARLGFGLSLDDFGTGYSSLARLQWLPRYELEIDRSLAHALQSDSANTLAGFIVDIDKRLGMTTVAESVENTDEHAMLAALGCDLVQGYFIGRATRAEALRHGLRQRQAVNVDEGVMDRAPFLA